MNTIFLLVSKLVGFLIRVDVLIVFGLALIALSLAMNWQRTAKTSSLLILFCVLGLSIFPLGELLLRPIERTYPANPPLSAVDGVIVLGGGQDVSATAFWKQPQLTEAADRLAAGMALSHRFPNAKIVFTGGSGRLRDSMGAAGTEAGVAEQFFLSQGLSSHRLLLERSSRNTAENASLSLELVQPGSGQTWVLITSAFHMPRAMRSFHRAGWKGLVPYPVDYRTGAFADRIGWNLPHNLRILNTAIKEIVGLAAHRILNR